MRQYTSKSILFMTAIALSACSHLPQTTSQGATVVSAQTVTQALGVDLASLEQKATALKPFEYIHNQDHYIAYLSTQPELIKVQKNGQLAKFFYQAGKVSFVQDKTGVYQFNQSGDVIAAIDAMAKNSMQIQQTAKRYGIKRANYKNYSVIIRQMPALDA